MNFDDEDKFVLNKSNIVMIIITSVLLIISIVLGFFLYKSLRNEVKALPDLETTLGRTSTISKRTTTIETTTTVTTTIPPDKSPYYKVDVNNILTDEILTKENISRDDAKKIVEVMFDFLNKFYNMGDDSLFNITDVIKFAHEGETDKITYKDATYGEIYQGKEIIEKAYAKSYIYGITYLKYDKYQVIYAANNKYYRLENKLDGAELVFSTVTINQYNNGYISADVKYYKSNYESEGYTAPVYKSVPIELMYENGRWKTKSYVFPLYK